MTPAITWWLPPSRLTAHQRIALAREIADRPLAPRTSRVRLIGARDEGYLIRRTDEGAGIERGTTPDDDGALPARPEIRVEILPLRIDDDCRTAGVPPQIGLEVRTGSRTRTIVLDGPGTLGALEAALPVLMPSGALQRLGFANTTPQSVLTGLVFLDAVYSVERRFASLVQRIAREATPRRSRRHPRAASGERPADGIAQSRP